MGHLFLILNLMSNILTAEIMLFPDGLKSTLKMGISLLMFFPILRNLVEAGRNPLLLAFTEISFTGMITSAADIPFPSSSKTNPSRIILGSIC